MVRNHAEGKRGKAKMVIKYKHFKDNSIFGYYISNKMVLFNKIQGVFRFSKRNCKSEYWLIKEDVETSLTTFGALKDIMSG